MALVTAKLQSSEDGFKPALVSLFWHANPSLGKLECRKVATFCEILHSTHLCVPQVCEQVFFNTNRTNMQLVQVHANVEGDIKAINRYTSIGISPAAMARHFFCTGQPGCGKTPGIDWLSLPHLKCCILEKNMSMNVDFSWFFGNHCYGNFILWWYLITLGESKLCFFSRLFSLSYGNPPSDSSLIIPSSVEF